MPTKAPCKKCKPLFDEKDGQLSAARAMQERSEGEQGRLQAEIAAIKADLATSKGDNSKLQKEVHDLKRDHDVTAAKLRDTDSELKAANKQLDDNKIALHDSVTQLKDSRVEVDEIKASLVESEKVKVSLLDREAQLSSTNEELLVEVEKMKASLLDREAHLSSTKEELAASKAEVVAMGKELATSVNTSVVVGLEKRVVDLDASLISFQDKQRALYETHTKYDRICIQRSICEGSHLAKPDYTHHEVKAEMKLAELKREGDAIAARAERTKAKKLAVRRQDYMSKDIPYSLEALLTSR